MRTGHRRAAIALLVATTWVAPTATFAEPTPTPSPDVTRTPIEQFRIDREEYLVALLIRGQQIRVINNVFKDSCDKATRDYKISMSLARTPDQKNFAATVRKNAIASAIVARDIAIFNLGAEPVPPIEPAKPFKISNKKKQR